VNELVDLKKQGLSIQMIGALTGHDRNMRIRASIDPIDQQPHLPIVR